MPSSFDIASALTAAEKASSAAQTSIVTPLERTPHLLDVSCPNKSDRNLLNLLLGSIAPQIYFDKGNLYQVMDSEGIITPVQLTASILRIKACLVLDHVRHSYVILSKYLQKGAFGSVYQLEEDWIAYNSSAEASFRSRVITSVSRVQNAFQVIKIQNVERYMSDEERYQRRITSIMKEFETTEHLPHLNALRPFFDSSTNNCFSVMNFIEGRDLFDLVSDDLENIINFSMDDRFEIALAILVAYKVQVFERGLIHADLKLENIKINKHNGKYVAFIMDYGNVQLEDKVEAFQPGTSGYASYEQVSEGRLTSKSDIFSLGRVLIMLLRPNIKEFFIYREDMVIQYYLSQPEIADWCRKVKSPLLRGNQHSTIDFNTKDFSAWFLRLYVKKLQKLSLMPPIFEKISATELTGEHRDSICNIIEAMVSYKPSKRPEVSTVIALFNAVVMERNPIIVGQAEELSTPASASPATVSEVPGTLFHNPAPIPSSAAAAAEIEDCLHNIQGP